jgi:hypothetical protein
MVGGVQFILLTSVAMLFYPGGTFRDPGTKGYLFFENFFSDLGRTQAHSGEPNWVSFGLFFVALSVAGVSFILFFVALPRLFAGMRAAWCLSVAGSVTGVCSGLAFLGIAFTPMNLYRGAHGNFVSMAFCSLLPVVVLYAAAIFLRRGYPNRFAFVFLGFAVILLAYLWLLFFGPGDLRLSVTWQKAIVYAQVVCMFIQGFGAWRLQQDRDVARAIAFEIAP